MIDLCDTTAFKNLILLETLQHMEFFDIINIKDVDDVHDMPEYSNVFITELKQDGRVNKLQTYNRTLQYKMSSASRAFANMLDYELIRLFSNDTKETYRIDIPWDNCTADPLADVTRTEIKEHDECVFYYPLRLYSHIRSPIVDVMDNSDVDITLRTVLSKYTDDNDIKIYMSGVVKLNNTGDAYLFKQRYGTLYVHLDTLEEEVDSDKITKIIMTYNIMPTLPTTHVVYKGVCEGR